MDVKLDSFDVKDPSWKSIIDSAAKMVSNLYDFFYSSVKELSFDMRGLSSDYVSQKSKKLTK